MLKLNRRQVNYPPSPAIGRDIRLCFVRVINAVGRGRLIRLKPGGRTDGVLYVGKRLISGPWESVEVFLLTLFFFGGNTPISQGAHLR